MSEGIQCQTCGTVPIGVEREGDYSVSFTCEVCGTKYED